MQSWSRAAMLGAVVLLTACGGGDAEEDQVVADDTTGGEDPPPAAEVGWEDMDHQQRAQFMQETVMPEMQAMFQEHDAERFATFTCATCHGEDMADVEFNMPNGLSPLAYSQIPAMFESDQPMAVFMTQRVWPRMGELLGQELYNQETGAGFSCMNCHATAEE